MRTAQALAYHIYIYIYIYINVEYYMHTYIHVYTYTRTYRITSGEEKGWVRRGTEQRSLSQSLKLTRTSCARLWKWS